MGLGCAVLSVGVWLALAAPTQAIPASDAHEVDYRDLPRSHSEVFMEVEATEPEIAFVRSKLRRRPDVQVFAFLDHPAALAEARRIFKDDDEFVKSLTADALPTSFRVRFRSHVDHGAFQTEFERLPGVDEVQFTPTKQHVRKARALDARARACRGEVDAEVFMAVRATTEQEDAVAAVLAAMDGIESVERVSHDGAAATFACLFPNERVPAASTLPASFRLRIRSLTVIVQLEQVVATMPGVDTIQN
jgi:cell division protein FtsX